MNPIVRKKFKSRKNLFLKSKREQKTIGNKSNPIPTMMYKRNHRTIKLIRLVWWMKIHRSKVRKSKLAPKNREKQFKTSHLKKIQNQRNQLKMMN